MLPVAAAGAVAGGIGGLLGFLANSSANDRAQMLNNQALQEWLRIQIPDPEQLKLALDDFVLQGTFSPQLEQAVKQDPSAFETIVTSEQHKGAQNRALSELERLGYEGGLSLQDKAQLEEAQARETSRSRGNRQAIGSEMARRGLKGSGYESVARLADESASAEQGHKNSLQTAAHAQNRALEAIMGAGELGTKLRSQEFGEKSQKAGAADRISRFNSENLSDVNKRNIGAQNQAQLYNLNQKQSIADRNTALRNYQQEHNKGLYQQRFENQAKRAAGISGEYGQLAGGERKQGRDTANFYANLGTGAATAAGAYAGQSAGRKKKRSVDYDDDVYEV